MHGVQSVGSVRGTSSHQHNPFIMVCDGSTTEEQGDCYGFSFVYSGEFLMEVEKDQMDQTRLVCGIHPENFEWKLESGESFVTPEIMMAMEKDSAVSAASSIKWSENISAAESGNTRDGLSWSITGRGRTFILRGISWKRSRERQLIWE